MPETWLMGYVCKCLTKEEEEGAEFGRHAAEAACHLELTPSMTRTR